MLGKFVARGRTAEIFRWEEEYVVKLFYDFISYEAVIREYENTLKICKGANICPSPMELIKYDNRDGIVYENVKGKSLTAFILENPLKLKEAGKLLAETQLKIHRIKGDNLNSVKEYLSDNITNSSKLEAFKKEEVLKILNLLPDDNILCHMDYHPDNVFYDGINTYVIDWMTAGFGNPIADIARTVLILRYAVVPFQNPLFRGFIKISREIIIKEYLKQYRLVNPFDMELFNKWLIVIAAARTREKLPGEEIKRILEIL